MQGRIERQLLVIVALATAVPLGWGWRSIASGQDERPQCWHEEFAELSFLEGAWEVHSAARLPSGDWDTTVARSNIQADLKRCLLVERFQGSRAGHEYEALGLLGFNSVERRLQRVWVDSEHGILVTYEGERQASEIVLEYPMVLRGQSILLRHVYLDIGEGAFTLESRRSNDQGQSWVVTWRARYSRSQFAP